VHALRTAPRRAAPRRLEPRSGRVEDEPGANISCESAPPGRQVCAGLRRSSACARTAPAYIRP